MQLVSACATSHLWVRAEDAAEHAAAVEAAQEARRAERPAYDARRPSADDEEAFREQLRDVYEEAVKRTNKYTTTLHALNSLIVKSSKLTKVTKVYRGSARGVSPCPGAR